MHQLQQKAKFLLLGASGWLEELAAVQGDLMVLVLLLSLLGD